MKRFFSPGYLSSICLLNEIRAHASFIKGDVLDVGCGTKPYEYLFQCTTYTGLETEFSGHNHSNTIADYFYDGKIFPFSDSQYDSVVCFQVLEHVNSVDGLLDEIYRVLKPGGMALLTAPFIWPEHETPYDFRRWSSFGYKNMFLEKKFEVVKFSKSGSFIPVVGSLICDYIREKQVHATKFLSFMAYFFINAIAALLLSLKSKSKNPDIAFYLDNVVVVRKPV